MKNDVNIFKRPGSPYYLCSYRVKVHDPARGDRSVQRTLSTQSADAQVAQKRANQKYKEDVERFHNKQAAAVNVRDDAPTCGQIVDLYLAENRNKGAVNAARNFLIVVAEGALILGDELGREKARGLRVTALNADHMLRWRKQAARITAGLEPRTDANVNFYMRTAKAVFSDRDVTETYNGFRLPLQLLNGWRKIAFLKAPKNGGYHQIPQPILDKMDKRARKFFLRVGAWFARHGTDGTLWAKGRAERFANQYRNAHACYWLMRRCGLRNTEVENLRWEWFKPDDTGKIWLHLVDYPYWKPKGTPGSVPVARELYEELVAIFGPPRPGPEGYVLLGTKDHRDDGVHRAASKFCRRHLGGDRNKSVYELRKQYGSEVAGEYGIETAAKLLRHADISTAWKHYIDVIKLRKVEAR